MCFNCELSVPNLLLGEQSTAFSSSNPKVGEPKKDLDGQERKVLEEKAEGDGKTVSGVSLAKVGNEAKGNAAVHVVIIGFSKILYSLNSFKIDTTPLAYSSSRKP